MNRDAVEHPLATRQEAQLPKGLLTKRQQGFGTEGGAASASTLGLMERD